MIGKTIIALTLIVTAMPSSATIYTLSVRGSVSNNSGLISDETDLAGIIRPIGSSLAGLPFELAYRIDTRQWNQVFERPSPDAAIVFRTDFTYGLRNNAVIASIRVGGVLLNDIGKPIDQFNPTTGIAVDSQLSNSQVGSLFQDFQITTSSGTNSSSGVYRINGQDYTGFRLAVNTGFRLALQPNSQIVVSPHSIAPFIIHYVSPSDGSGPNGHLSFYSSYSAKGYNAYFDVSDISLTREPGGIPEPASWALFIAGFGLTGAAARQRRKTMRITYD